MIEGHPALFASFFHSGTEGRVGGHAACNGEFLEAVLFHRPTIEAAAEETAETQAAEESQPAVTAEEPQVTEAPQESDPYGGQLVWISETGSKYHNKNNCGRMNPDRAYQMTRENAEAQGYEPCKKCF